MENNHEIIHLDDEMVGEAEKIASEEELVEIGQWYWVKSELDGYNAEFLNENEEMLMCVSRIGSNFAELRAPSTNGQYRDRVHFNGFAERCRRENSWEAHLQQKVGRCREKTKQLMLEVKEVTARLGVGQRTQLGAGDNMSSALVAVSGTENVDDYKTALVKAEKEKLPVLFKKIKESNELMARWMQAEAIPMEAQAAVLEGLVGQIKDRIFNVEIYSGLTEVVVQVRDGSPANLKAKLHIMQRRHYMDEECLLNYRHGGMSFKNIEAFDKWIADDENMYRILPFDRCMVAFKIRRITKERSRSMDSYTKFWYERNDRQTYMYVRNGEQLFRMSTSMDFGEKIFPDTKEFNAQELWVNMGHGSRVGEFISNDDYEIRCKNKIEADKFLEADKKRWVKERKAEGRDDDIFWYSKPSPWREHAQFEKSYWQRFDPDNVYYDDMEKKLADDVKEYNRISLIIQGLYDRSPVLHPHPPVQLWDYDSFKQNITLIYDQDCALSAGERPDIKAYIDKCNSHLKVGALTIGQEDLWELKEGAKETARINRSWRSSSQTYRPERSRPYGDPGPGYIAEVKKLTGTGKATFEWKRSRQTEGYGRDGVYHYSGETIDTKITVNAGELFCIDGYNLGDFLKFFEDPRTRAEYLEWAPLLLAAEEYHHGKLKVGETDGKVGYDKRYEES